MNGFIRTFGGFLYEFKGVYYSHMYSEGLYEVLDDITHQ